jgi:AAA domain-containing protein
MTRGVEVPKEWRRTAPATIEGRILIGKDIREGVEPPDELVQDIILAGRVTSVYSGSGMGKTFLMLWIILRVIEQGLAVVVFDKENGRRIIAERLEALGADPEKLDENLHYYSSPSLPLDAAVQQAFEALLDEVKPALIVYDSWINFLADASLDENVSNDIARWAAAYTHPARERGIAVLLLDHVPKEGVSARGSGRKKDEVDVMFKLANPAGFDRDTVGRIVLAREKDREGWLPGSVGFSVGGGENGFIFQRSEGTIEEADDEGLKPSERKVLEVLVEEFDERGAKAAEWQKACKVRDVSRPSFYRAKKWLLTTERVEELGGRYYARQKPQLRVEVSEVSNRSHETNETGGKRSQRSHGSTNETRETSRPSADTDALGPNERQFRERNPDLFKDKS